MKYFSSIQLIGLLTISLNSLGQTSDNKNNISIGGGKESYNGDLGNAWFKLDEEWYGFVSIHYNRYFNKSFDFNASLMAIMDIAEKTMKVHIDLMVLLF